MKIPLEFIACGLLGVGLCWAFWYFSEAQRVKRQLIAAPISPIARLRERDVVRVVGSLVLGPRALTAPLSGRACAAFLVRGREVGARNSVEVIRESEAVEFSIDDGTGTVVIRPDRFMLGLIEDHNEISGHWQDASASLSAYLASRGQSSKGTLGFNRALQFHEAVLEVGERVAVLGIVVREPDPAPQSAGDGYRDRPMRLAIVAPPGGAMLLSDAPETTT